MMTCNHCASSSSCSSSSSSCWVRWAGLGAGAAAIAALLWRNHNSNNNNNNSNTNNNSNESIELDDQTPFDASMSLLSCAVQKYAWGRLGKDSAVAQLRFGQGQGDECERFDAAAPYAELWMGTHKRGPSACCGDKAPSLCRWLNGRNLPYLYKVLSVNKALSIQAHPDRALAQKLHAERPNVYGDPNHKPEMAYALTPFQALCGFRDMHEIVHFLKSVPEFRRVLLASDDGSDAEGQKLVDSLLGGQADEELLRQLFTRVMKADKERVEQLLRELMQRLQGEDERIVNAWEASAGGDGAQQNALEINELVQRLYSQYPGDVGVFAPFFLNAFVLQPGQAVFLGPNLPHAYLDGNCVECMACSDNVVRAGLTPKLRDVDTLCSMLQYTTGMPQLLTGERVDALTRRYAPPADSGVDEFQLHTTAVPSKHDSGKHSLPYAITHVDCKPVPITDDGADDDHSEESKRDESAGVGCSDSIVLVNHGSGTFTDDRGVTVDVEKGSVVAIRGGSRVELTSVGDNGIVFFRCSSMSS